MGRLEILKKDDQVIEEMRDVVLKEYKRLKEGASNYDELINKCRRRALEICYRDKNAGAIANEVFERQIKKELEEKNSDQEKEIQGKNGMYEITVHEKKYINQDDARVTVSFQLPFRDWSILEKSNAWHQIEDLLLEIQHKHSRMYRQDPE